MKLKIAVCLVLVAVLLWGSGVAPAIVPALVPTANKKGNSTVFQLATLTGVVAGDCATWDASGNLIDSGFATCGGAGTTVNSVYGLTGTVVPTAHNQATSIACPSSSASGTTYTCSTTPSFTPAAGDVILWKPDVANTGAATLNVNGLGAKAITKQQNVAALVANDVRASPVQLLMAYDGTSWEMQGQIGNSGTAGATSLGGALVQSNFLQSALAIAMTFNVTSGNLIVVAVHHENGSATPTAADTVGTTYSLAGTILAGSRTSVLYGLAAGSGANTITVTSAGASFAFISYAEVKGYTTLDVFASSASANVQFTSTAASDFVFSGSGGFQNGSTEAVHGALNIIGSANGGDSFATGAYIAGTAGVWPAQWFNNDSTPSTVVAAFK